MPHIRGDEPASDVDDALDPYRMPHIRGDEPKQVLCPKEIESRMPHIRGDDPADKQREIITQYVCPTYVEMNRFDPDRPPTSEGMPHIRGDEPLSRYSDHWTFTYAPHTWG